MNISFSATTEQVRQHRKHCTRRIDKSLRLAKKKPSDILQGIERGQGIKKGEHVVKLDQIVILEVNREPLDEIIRRPVRHPTHLIEWSGIKKQCSHFSLKTGENYSIQQCNHPQNSGIEGNPCGNFQCPGVPEVDLEGFPELTPIQFVETFCKINPECTPDTEITRVLFDYVEPVKGWLVAK